MKPLISIVVPVYNVEEYINECIESIQKQTYTNLEILVINDGTKDRSIEVIKDLMNDPRIQVINQSNQGLSGARNTGMRAAKGKYISLIDSDDKVKPTFIEELYQKAIETDADIVRGSFRDFDGNVPDGWVTDFNICPSKGTEALKQFLNQSLSFVVWSSLYKTSFLRNKKLEFTPGILLEDGDFTTRSYLLASCVATVDTPNYCYRIRPGSILTTNNSQKMSDSELFIINKFIKFHQNTMNAETKSLIEDAIYAFMRDWTRIIVKDTVQFPKSHFTSLKSANKIIKPTLRKRPLKEKIKYAIKINIIKYRYK
ncbi:glycosyltransferase family 2 protein [Lactococcus lactis]|uniref:Glycosyltransferase n=1 Tax=Lactococcus lactis TaxID=1358 RepID=A0AB35KCZ8_9LACT|nr:glycosyltransferase [Lactococcus lactis]MDG5049598.1 glycosyltransferase [Lactococcus lactis]